MLEVEAETPLDRTLASMLRKRNGSSVTDLAFALLVRGIADGYSADAVRKVVIRLSHREPLRAFFASNVSFMTATKAAARFVALGRSDAGRREMLDAAAKSFVAGPLTLNRLVGMSAREEVAARNTLAVVGKMVLQSIAQDGMNTAVVSLSKLEALLGRSRENLAADLDWGVQSGFLKRVSVSQSRAGRYALRSVDARQSDGLRNLFDVVDAVAASATKLAALEVAPVDADDDDSLDASIRALIADEIEDIEEADFFEEFQAERAKRNLARGIKRVGESNPFGTLVTGLWTPSGMLTGLSPTLVADTLADALMSADSVIWRPRMTGGTLTLSDWLYLVESAAGFEIGGLGTAKKSVKENRLRRLMPGLVGRLNDGESLNSILATVAASGWGEATQQMRLDAWRESSSVWALMKKENAAMFERGQGNIELLIPVIGEIPHPENLRAREVWVAEGRHHVFITWGTLAEDAREATVIALLSRMKRRGYDEDEARMMLDELLPVA